MAKPLGRVGPILGDRPPTMPARSILAVILVLIIGLALAKSSYGGSANQAQELPLSESPASHHDSPGPPPGANQRCAYSAHSIARLTTFEKVVNHRFSCVEIFGADAATWDGWSNPWYLRRTDPDNNWAAWKKADPDRRLILSIGMVPTSAPDSWRAEGAAGSYDAYAVRLASLLVNAGVGDSVIRIAHEGNGPWFHYWFGDTSKSRADWVRYWRRIAQAMRTVPGAKFTFEWTVAPGFDSINLADYYPGDDVVDIVGLAFHDYSPLAEGWRSPEMDDRFDRQYFRLNGPAAVLDFAASHHKFSAISEWGVIRSRNGIRGGDDNPEYISRMMMLIQAVRPQYDTIWIGNGGDPDALFESPRSLQQYRDDIASN